MPNREAEPQLTLVHASEEEVRAYREITTLLQECPIPPREKQANLALYLNRAELAHVLFVNEIYRRILGVHGIVVEFGTRWGRNLALFTSLRTVYEPYNFQRRIVGFDTFSGFPGASREDGDSSSIAPGVLSVTEGYPAYLERILAAHEKLAPRSHIQKFEIVQGDVVETLPKFLDDNPHTMIALAYFDLDLYEPTLRCLELVRPHMVRGGVLAFDELAHPEFPGETVALKKVEGLSHLKVERLPFTSYESFAVIP